MNENFNFLASEMREKSVYCDNGETITDAINEGYNSITIYGTCDSTFMVYMIDPSPFDMNFSDLPHKPLSHLIIKGGEDNKASKIVSSNNNFTSGVGSNGFLQLYNLTIESRLNADEGSSMILNNISYEVKNLQENDYSQLTAYKNSFIKIKDSIINAEIKASESSIINISYSDINPTSNREYVLNLKKNSHSDTHNSNFNGRISLSRLSSLDEEGSTINCSNTNNCVYSNHGNLNFQNTTFNCDTNFSCIEINNTNLGVYEAQINLTTEEGFINAQSNSVIELSDLNFNCPSNSSSDTYKKGCVKIETNCSMNVSNSTINTENTWGLEAQWGSILKVNNVNLNRADTESSIHLNASSSLQISSGSQDLSLDCGSNTFVQNQTNISISGGCNNY